MFEGVNHLSVRCADLASERVECGVAYVETIESLLEVFATMILLLVRWMFHLGQNEQLGRLLEI